MMLKKKEFTQDVNNTNKILNGEEEMDMAQPTDNTDMLVREWQRDARQLKLIVGDFSLDDAVKSEVFANALRNGATVFEAYKEMISVPKPKEKREEIFQNARSARRGTGGASPNPAKLSSEEFKKYIDNIKNN